MRRIADQRGQATVELVALLPVLAALLAALWQAVLAGQAVWAATTAARAAARADAVGADAARAPREPISRLARAAACASRPRTRRRGPRQRPHPRAPGPAEPRPRPRRRPLRAAVMTAASAGQATVELVALLPLARCSSRWPPRRCSPATARGEQAGQAAQAGAMALLQGGDPRDAARRALPAGVRRASRDRGPRPAGHGPRPPARCPSWRRAAMTAEVTADAGPEAAP